MTVLLIIFGSVIVHLVGWAYTARFVATRWANGTDYPEYSRDNAGDRKVIAFLALLVSIPWPLVLPYRAAAEWLFNSHDRVDVEERRRVERLTTDIRYWTKIAKNSAATADERALARQLIETLRGQL